MNHVKSDDKTVRINTKLPESLRSDFLAVANKQGTSASTLIRGWIERYVRDNTQVSPFESFKDTDPELYKQYLELKERQGLP